MVVILATACLTACSGGSSAQEVAETGVERAAQEYGSALGALLSRSAGESADQVLQHLPTAPAGSAVTPVGRRAMPTGEVRVDAVVDVNAQTGGGLSYESWTARMCVTYRGSPGQADVHVTDAACPSPAPVSPLGTGVSSVVHWTGRGAG